METDLRLLAGVFANLTEFPLPLVDLQDVPPFHAWKVFTDASGGIPEDYHPHVGIYIPSQNWQPSQAVSLPFPAPFLTSEHSMNALPPISIYRMSGLLEACGPLAALILFHEQLRGSPVLFITDNRAVQLGFKKRSSRSPLLSTLLRATRFVSNMMGSRIYFKWEPRRSSLIC